jgi:hypothetical protein
MLFSVVGTFLLAYFFTAVDNLIDLNTYSLFVSVLKTLEQINQHFTADPPPQSRQRQKTTIEMTSRTRKLQLSRSNSSHEIPDVDGIYTGARIFAYTVTNFWI